MISLYPCANLECNYPTGHPEFIDQPGTTDISKFYGLVKCKILPPYEPSRVTLQIRIGTFISALQNMCAKQYKTRTPTKK